MAQRSFLRARALAVAASALLLGPAVWAQRAEPMRSMLKVTPDAERPAVIMALPRLFARASDRKQVPALIEQALQSHADAPATRVAVGVAMGRAWVIAEDPSTALGFAQRAH